MQCFRLGRFFLAFLIMTTPVLQAMHAIPLTAMNIIQGHTAFDMLRKHVVMQASSSYQLAKADPHYFTRLLERPEFRPAVDALHPEKRVGVHQLAEALQHAIHTNPANPAAVGAAYTKLFHYLNDTCTKDLQVRSYLLNQIKHGKLSFASIDEFNAYQKHYEQTLAAQKQARKAAKITPRKLREHRQDQQGQDQLNNGQQDSDEQDDDQQDQITQNQGFWRGILSWIMKNKVKAAVIGAGAGLTIYGVLAKLLSWWPFNDTAEQGQPVNQG